MRIYKVSSVRGRLLEFIVVIVLLSVFLVFFSRRYIFNCNPEETTRRVGCLSNFNKIATLLKEKDLQLKVENIPAINDVLAELKLTCPSGRKMHARTSIASYKVVELPTNDIVITEDANNHNTQKMRFTNKPYIRFCLYTPLDDTNDIRLGYWETKEVAIDNIKLFEGDVR